MIYFLYRSAETTFFAGNRQPGGRGGYAGAGAGLSAPSPTPEKPMGDARQGGQRPAAPKRDVGAGPVARERDLYQSAFTQASLGMAILGPTGSFLAANRHLAEMLGYSEHELKSRGLAELARAEDRVLLEELWRQMRDQGIRAAQQEFRLRHKLGHLVWALMKCTLVRDPKGRPSHLVCLFLDVTRRREAEAALLESEEKYRTIFETSGTAMIIIEEDTTVSLANNEFIALTGASREYVDSRPSWREVIAEDDVERMLAYHRLRRGDPGAAPRAYEAKVKDGRGGLRQCLVTVGVIPGTARSVASLLDLTGLKRAEAERARLEEELRQAQKMEAIGTLAGGVAHDFNNILASILGFTEIALHDFLEPDHPARRPLEQVVKACRRARDLAGRILTFSRRGAEERRPLNLAGVVAEGLELLRASLPSTIRIRVEVAPEVAAGAGVVLGEPTQLQQVLLNLCANAAQAMGGPGGVQGGTLGVALDLWRSPGPEVGPLPELEPGRYLRLTVSDTGPGMEPRVVERVFEPYFTTKSHGEGTGLGLAVVHGIVKGHQGGIQVESAPGRGSVFRVFLPLAPGLAADEPAPKQAERGRGERLLLVDDEPEVVEMAATMLANLGYQVRAFESSPAALAAFLAAPAEFDMAITDQTMPLLTGVELTRALLQARPDLPVILCSGYSGTLEAKDVEALGIRRFLSKPIDREELARCVREVLGGRA